MDALCGNNSFWDTDQTWGAEWPQFSACFQDLVLDCGPCLVLWAELLVYLPWLLCRRKMAGGATREWLFWAKQTSSTVLLVLCLISIFMRLGHVGVSHETDTLPPAVSSILGPGFQSASMVAVMVVVGVERQQGAPSCPCVLLFWLLMVLTELVSGYNDVTRYLQDKEAGVVKLAVDALSVTVAGIQLALHSISSVLPLRSQEQCPQCVASFPSCLTYSWLNRLMSRGYKEELHENDVIQLSPRDRMLAAGHELQRRLVCQTVRETESAGHGRWWKRCVSKRKTRRPHTITADVNENTPLLTSKEASELTASQQTEGSSGSRGGNKKVALYSGLFRTFWCSAVISNMCKLPHDLLALTNPLLLGQLIRLCDDVTVPAWKGYVIGVALCASLLLQSLLFQVTFHLSTTLGLRVKAALTAAIFKKMLTVDSEGRRLSPSGELINLVSADTNHVTVFLSFLPYAWSSPVQVALCVFCLHQVIGNAAFAGAGFLAVLIPLNAWLMSRLGALQTCLMEHRDSRLQRVSHILNNIKTVKVQALEALLGTRVSRARDSELTVLQRLALLDSWQTVLWTMAPFCMALITFTTHVFTDVSGGLTSEEVFVTLSYLGIFRGVVSVAPMVISDFVKAAVSVKRLDRFLSHGDLDPDSVTLQPWQEDTVMIRSATCSWRRGSEPCLKGLSLSITEGSLVAVVGPMASGKSSLLAAILGELHVQGGHVSVNCQPSYVPQQPWLRQATVRANIVGWPHHLHLARYEATLRACAFTSDLAAMPAGDLTEIGENGVTLSGGQRQRINLARAVYESRDLYLMDDPISAVDSRVGRQIYQEVIGQKGLLRDATRIVVTSTYHWLPEADVIVVMSQGEVVEMGNYNQLMSQGHHLPDLMSKGQDHLPGLTLQDHQDHLPGLTLQDHQDHLPGLTLQGHQGHLPRDRQTGRGQEADTIVSSTMLASDREHGEPSPVTPQHQQQGEDPNNTEGEEHSQLSGCLNPVDHPQLSDSFSQAFDADRKQTSEILQTLRLTKEKDTWPSMLDTQPAMVEATSVTATYGKPAFVRSTDVTAINCKLALVKSSDIGTTHAQGSRRTCTDSRETDNSKSADPNSPGCTGLGSKAGEGLSDRRRPDQQRTADSNTDLHNLASPFSPARCLSPCPEESQQEIEADDMALNATSAEEGPAGTDLMQTLMEHSEEKVLSEDAGSRDSMSDFLVTSHSGRWRCREMLTSLSCEVVTKSRRQQHRPLVEDEQVAVGKVKWRVYFAIAGAMGILSSVVMAVSYSMYHVSSVAANYWLSHWTDVTSLSSDGNPSNDFYLAVYGGLGVAQCIFATAFGLLLAFRRVRAARSLHSRLLHSMLSAPLHFFQRNPSARMLNRMSRDLEVVDVDLWFTLEIVLDSLCHVISTCVVVCFTSLYSVPVLLPVGAAYYFIQRYYVRTSRQLRRLESKSRSPFYAHLSDTFSGCAVVRAAGAQATEHAYHTAATLVDRNLSLAFASNTATRWLGVRVALLGVVVVGVATMMGVAWRDSNTGGILGLTITYALDVTENLNWLVRMLGDLETNAVSVERVLEYSDLTPEDQDAIPRVVPCQQWPREGRVQFVHLWASHPTCVTTPVVKNVHCTIHPGEKVGVVGRTGAGKTSLWGVLLGLMTVTEGAVIIDDVDTRSLPLQELRRRIGVMPQEPLVLEGSVHLNLAPEGGVREEELWAGLELTQLADHVRALPGGLDYVCHSDGRGFSAGQKQLLCLTRLLLRHCRVMVLDEVTSSVDKETETAIVRAVQRACHDVTVLLVSHRLSTVRFCDRVMVVDGGRVVEMDSPDRLLADPFSHFSRLAASADLLQ